MSDLPKTTLYMLTSVDGKISTGSGDDIDFDKDLPNVEAVAKGLHQYYDLEQETDLFSLNTGKVMAKVGWNEQKTDIKQLPVSFIIIDNKPHLTSDGVLNLVRHSKKLYIVTTNSSHPATSIQDKGLEIIRYENEVDFKDLFGKLRAEGAVRLTVQSGGEMNATLVRQGLINYLSIVVAPVLVGGKNTPSLIDGESLASIEDLRKLRTLKLQRVKALDNSYIHLSYKVE